MGINKIKKVNKFVELEKKIEVYYQLIRRGVDVSKNNDRIEECLKEKSKHYVAFK
jgi:hypothetical protein